MTDQFLADYIACALWSSHDESDESGGQPFDASYGPNDLAPETLAIMTAECRDFELANWDDLQAYEARTSYTGAPDFWLTRNGYGAGFWDRGLGELGNRLTQAAHDAGERDLYLGDDGRIYQS